jgi:hypothetical protein
MDNKKDILINVLFAAIKNTRMEPGLSLEETSQVIANSLEQEELDSLIVELLDRQLENHSLGKCLFCGNKLEQEEFDNHKGICKNCRDKEIEEKIQSDLVESEKPNYPNNIFD